jgi:hypothetical protein
MNADVSIATGLLTPDGHDRGRARNGSQPSAVRGLEPHALPKKGCHARNRQTSTLDWLTRRLGLSE